MADNTDNPCGLKPLEPILSTHYYRLTNNYGSAVFIYDPVVTVAAGTVELHTAGHASQANAITGSVLGVYKQEDPKSGRPEKLIPVQYHAASPGTTYDYWVLVADDPNQFFVMQEDGDTTPLTYPTDLGTNCDLIFTHTGNTITGISKCEIDSNTKTATATYYAVKLVDLWYGYDVDAGQYNTADGTAAYAKWVVKINNHMLASNATGI